MPIQMCNVDINLSGWIVASTSVTLAICIFGFICNVASLICCRYLMKKAMKLQLMIIFGLQAAICTTTLPMVTYLYYNHSYCLVDPVTKEVQILFAIVNSMLLQWERLSFTVLALYRAIAVIFPHHSHRIAKTKIVVFIQIGFSIVIAPAWSAMGFMKAFGEFNTGGHVMKYEGKYAMTLYCIFYLLPFLITSAAYVSMVASLARRNKVDEQNNENSPLGSSQGTPSNRFDHVSQTTSILVLINLFLDGPHVIVHFLSEVELASIITHMIFYSHLVLDPAIFVGMNKEFREMVRSKMPCLKAPSGRQDLQSKDTDLTLDQIK